MCGTDWRTNFARYNIYSWHFQRIIYTHVVLLDSVWNVSAAKLLERFSRFSLAWCFQHPLMSETVYRELCNSLSAILETSVVSRTPQVNFPKPLNYLFLIVNLLHACTLVDVCVHVFLTLGCSLVLAWLLWLARLLWTYFCTLSMLWHHTLVVELVTVICHSLNTYTTGWVVCAL